ncbi:hypothetical protein FOC4_g10001694 [Fusarium odoratissimum]|uniref:BZIP domain-containing protein n=1 Tax=Fusarium oxysporum f. sp. cubense (strain race 4) TaxID=2502994 RepID=N1SAH4_FUSC4|nr:hypothetical protein FOC4_g10001694 [Fusarium odoratissimum]
MNVVFTSNPSSTPASLGVNANASDLECQGVTDPRAKKRLQNRVAQRSYRRRVKSRIADLQKKVAQYEDANSSKESPETGEQPRAHGDSVQQRTSYTSPETTNRGSTQGLPEILASRSTREKTQESSTHRNSNYTLSPASSLAPRNQISGPPVAKAGRSYQHVGSGRETQQSRRSSFVTEPHEANGDLLQAHFDDITVNQNTSSAILQSFPTSTFDTAASHPPFITDELEEELDLGWMIANTEVEGRNSCSCDKSSDQNPRPSSTNSNSLKNQSSTARLPSYASSSRSPTTVPRESLNARFQNIMECVGAMGFESFDDLVTSYYADEFEEASKLFHEQRFSRFRRLPGVFAEILEYARRWEPAERRGLGEEVLKEAEAVLMLESSEAWQSLQSNTDAAMTNPRRRRVKSRIADLQKKVAQYEDANSSKESPETGEQPRAHGDSVQQRTSYTSPETTNRGSTQGLPEILASRSTREKTQESSTHRNSNYTLSPASSLAPRNQISGPPVAKAGRSYQHVGSGRETQQSRRSSFVTEPHEANGDLLQAHFDDITVNQNTSSAILQSFPTSTFDTAASHPPFITDELEEELDLGWMIANTEVEGRNSCSCDKSSDQNPRPSSTNSNSLKNQSSTARLPSYASSSRSPTTVPRESLNARFQNIMECVGAMGFESFDDLVTSYYADEFEEASKLFHEQRFSRIRRLPGVFAEILEYARRWEPAERRGLGEEVLKEAEAVLMLESSEAWQSLQSNTDAAMTKDNISTEQVYQNISTVLPMEHPIVRHGSEIVLAQL